LDATSFSLGAASRIVVTTCCKDFTFLALALVIGPLSQPGSQREPRIKIKFIFQNRAVAIGITTGTANKSKIYFSKQSSHHHNLLWKNQGKEMVCKTKLESGVDYV